MLTKEQRSALRQSAHATEILSPLSPPFSTGRRNEVTSLRNLKPITLLIGEWLDGLSLTRVALCVS